MPADRPVPPDRRARAGLSTAPLITVALTTSFVAAAAVGPAAGATNAGPESAASASARTGLTAFRVDVSRYPRIGLVVTIPAGPHRSARDFTVRAGNRSVHPSAISLTGRDLQVVLAPDTGTGPAVRTAEQAATARFLIDLPPGGATGIVDPSGPPLLTPHLDRDPVAAEYDLTRLGSAARPAAQRLTEALAGFSGGPTARRTVVLVAGRDESLSPSVADLLRRRLVASGTAVYLLDLSPHGLAGLAALATGSGGFVARLGSRPTASTFDAAFSQVLGDLGNQYYLRFSSPVALPGAVDVAVRTPAGTRVGPVYLPATNPVAPALPPAVWPRPRPVRWDLPLVGLSMLLVVFGLLYGMVMLVASRREPGSRRIAGPGGAHRASVSRRSTATAVPAGATPPVNSDDPFFVFLLPCLNEETVILASLERLLSIPGDNFVVVAIDDGSDDGTAAVVSSVVGDRVWLVRRIAPEARQGKGEALNAAVRTLLSQPRVADRDPDRVVVVVVDADGRLDPQAVAAVTPYFDDPRVGAVQIGVRINNRQHSWLARMQDMEFVIYTEVFQRGRRHLGSVGLGGNGQFMRLSALQSLGPAPWTRSLTDDLDLGVRFLTAGWSNDYCSSVAVHQQGVVELRRLIRQRSRWFQGHLQSWKLIPIVLRSAPRRARADLLYHLTSPALLLIASLLSMSFLLSLIDSAFVVATGGDPFGWWVVSSYLLTFGPALAFGYVYWTRERATGMPLARAGLLAHCYVGYGLIWYASGWWAVGRTLRGRTGWAKTDRVAEATPSAAVDPNGQVEPNGQGAEPVVRR